MSKKKSKSKDQYVHPNDRPKICACCGATVTVMCEWFDEHGDIYCGAACRRGKCVHKGYGVRSTDFPLGA